jgi:DNA-binding Xre family transcriptional regulator
MALLSEKAKDAINKATVPPMRRRELARRIGVTEQRLSLMISGRLQVKAEEMLILADIFNLEPADIVQIEEATA